METKKKEVYQGAINTIVKIIDWTPINEKISKTVGFDVECKIGNAFIPDVEAVFNDKLGKQVRSMIVDKECCGVDTKSSNFLVSDLEDKPFNVSLFEGIGFFKVKKSKEGFSNVAIFPSFYFSIDVDDVKRCLTGEEIPLYKYMDSRYFYNSRIRYNENDILSLVYQKCPIIKVDGSDVEWNDTVDLEIN